MLKGKHLRAGTIEMTKSYSEQLGEWVKRRPKATQPDKNLVAFLAVKDDVQEAIAKGYAIKTIWVHMHEHKRIAFCYDTFLKYVHKRIRQAQLSPASGVPITAARDQTPRPMRSLAAQSVARPAPAVAGEVLPPPLASFSFNAAPNKEELI